MSQAPSWLVFSASLVTKPDQLYKMSIRTLVKVNKLNAYSTIVEYEWLGEVKGSAEIVYWYHLCHFKKLAIPPKIRSGTNFLF